MQSCVRESVTRVYLEGVGLRGTGLPDWSSAQAILAGRADYAPGAVRLQPSEFLAAGERRRTTDSVKLAMAVAGEAVSAAGLNRASLPSVFASSDVDGDVVNEILQALAKPEREVSPTQFHNSVHNAPSGYWSIGSRSRESCTSLSGYDSSFGVGLLEAGSEAVYGNRPVLLVCYDLPQPWPLGDARPLSGSFGVAVVLSPAFTERSLICLTLALERGVESSMTNTALELLRKGNPAARCLPLLAAFAQRQRVEVTIPLTAESALKVTAVPLNEE